MKVILENTDKIVTLVTRNSITARGGEIPARIWEGTTENGIRVHAFITRIAVHRDADNSQFERELQETRPLSKELTGVYDARLIL